jgi:hypothetical protein
MKKVVPSLIEDGFSVLQYTGNTVKFYVSQYWNIGNEDKIAFLHFWKKKSSFIIKFHKSSIFFFGKEKDCES